MPTAHWRFRRANTESMLILAIADALTGRHILLCKQTTGGDEIRRMAKAATERASKGPEQHPGRSKQNDP